MNTQHMIKESRIIQICVASSIILLPVAHLKVILFSVPLYSVEIPVIIAFFTFLTGIWNKGGFPSFKLSRPSLFSLGIGIFLFGIILSFLMNEMSLRGLGMIKTWFVMPIILLSLWIRTHPKKRDIDILLLLWFGVLASVSLLSNIFLFQGILTFDGRLSSWYSSPNYLAFFIAPGILLAQYFFYHPIFQSKRWDRRIIIGISLSLFLTLFFTRSYSTWIAVFLSNSLFIFLSRKYFHWKDIVYLSIFSCLLFVSFLFLEKDTEKWQSLVSLSDRSSSVSRLMIWKSSYKMMIESPLFGIGIGRFQETYLEYQKFFSPYLEWSVPQPHNLYLAILLQSGMIGFFGFLLILFSWLRDFPCLLEEQEKSRYRVLSIILFLFLLIGFVDTPFFKTDLVFSLWLLFFFERALLLRQKK